MTAAPKVLDEIIRDGAPRFDDTVYVKNVGRLLSAFRARSFHCAHSVLAEFRGVVTVDERCLDMTHPFVCGLAFSGGTCAAAAAGVLAIGRAARRIEESRLRVFLMMARMLVGGDMMANDVNNFNPAINQGERLVQWFLDTYGSLRCADVTGLDIERPDTVERYLSSGGIRRCEEIAAAVATKTRDIIGEMGTGTESEATR